MPYRAEDTRIFRSVVTANEVYLEVYSINGPIQLSNWNNSDYRIEAKIKARASWQQEAEERLSDLEVELKDNMAQEEQTLILRYDVPLIAHSRHPIDVSVVLPASTTVSIDLHSSNGDIHLVAIDGDRLRIETSNGRLILNKVYAESTVGTTSNGQIEGEVEAQETDISTNNGEISLTPPSTVSGEIEINTSNAAIELKVHSSPNIG